MQATNTAAIRRVVCYACDGLNVRIETRERVRTLRVRSFFLFCWARRVSCWASVAPPTKSLKGLLRGSVANSVPRLTCICDMLKLCLSLQQ